jgi:hypothetical protein
MFLEFGVTQDGQLIHIDIVGRGLTELHCPYCNGLLLAKKGKVKIPHFAHAGKTCREVASRDDGDFRLPYYDKFNLGLSPRKLAFLHALKDNKWADETENITYALEVDGFIKEAYKVRPSDYGYELTSLGKAPLGLTSLEKFAAIQLERMMAQHSRIEKAISDARKTIEEARETIGRMEHNLANPPKWNMASPEDYGRSYKKTIAAQEELIQRKEGVIKNSLIDLSIYRAQLRRVFSASLYFLEIKHAGGILYKIGVSNRLKERIEEIKPELEPLLGEVDIKILHELRHRGAIEFYFKHRYREHQHRIGNLTEYYSFDTRKNVLSDLTKLGDYAPDEFMQRLIEGQLSDIETLIENEHLEAEAKAHAERRRKAISKGMRKAAAKGQTLGRPLKADDAILAEYPQVVEMLGQGIGIREISRLAGVARNTVRKVKEAKEAKEG